MKNNTINTPITENTTLGDLLAIIGSVPKAEKTPTSKALRETAGEPLATEERCKVYANGYAVFRTHCIVASRLCLLYLSFQPDEGQ